MDVYSFTISEKGFSYQRFVFLESIESSQVKTWYLEMYFAYKYKWFVLIMLL